MSRFARRRGDHGFAMIMVIGSMAVLTIFVTGALTFAMTNIKPARHDQDWQAALAAAQAGVDDYTRHLEDNDSYWTLVNNDPANPALSTTNWLTVPGATGTNVGQFHYYVLDDIPTMSRNADVRLRVTGKANNVQRTIEVDLRKNGFLKFLYYTDFETLDPSLESDPAWAATNCNKYYYTGRASNCTDIQWITNDLVNGPLHTNDAMYITGTPRFTDVQTESSWPDGSNPAPQSSTHRWYGSGSPATSPTPAYKPVYAAPVLMPPSNTQIKTQAQATGGCLYTGPTRIILKSNGKMDVMSPKTTSPNAGCGTGTMSNVQTDIPLPSTGVIYVQSGTGTCSLPELKPAAATNGFPGYPQGYTDNATKKDVTSYDCKAGDVFVEGTLKGQLTIAADNNVIVTGDTKYSDGGTGTDVLGLVANNFAQVYHPVNSNGDNLAVQHPDGTSSTLFGIEIDAALLSVQHSFLVQNYNKGAALSDSTHKLKVFGVIAQEYRGPVGTSSGGNISTGYYKDYNYDSRLMVLPPPYFLLPVAAPWQVSSMSEQKNP